MGASFDLMSDLTRDNGVAALQAAMELGEKAERSVVWLDAYSSRAFSDLVVSRVASCRPATPHSQFDFAQVESC